MAPARIPEDLIWFKWESYSTWLSGFALLVVVYWAGAELYLIDPTKMDLSIWMAIGISAASLGLGWMVYDILCKSRLGHQPTVLMALLFVIITAMGWFYDQVFTGRAAMLHLGAFTATIMTANVFFIIIPNQKIVVAELLAGKRPSAEYGRIAKLRSTHNNYLTLPIIFLMLSNHYPLAFASEWNWLIASLVFLMGVTIRHFFNTMHAKKPRPWWTWGATAALFAAIVALSAEPLLRDYDAIEEARLGPAAARFAAAPGFAEVEDIVYGRCAMCHAEVSGWEGIGRAPKGVHFETAYDVATQARAIYLQSGVTHAMPPGNVSYMEPQERAAIIAWYRAGLTGRPLELAAD